MKKLSFFIFILIFLASCNHNDLPVADVDYPDLEQIAMVNKIWNMDLERMTQIDKDLSQFPQEQREQRLLEILELEPALVTTQYVGRMNSQEAALCASNLYNCWKTKGTVSHSENRAAAHFGSSLWLGRGDAFRHAYWNALMVSEISWSWAETWANAHEAFSPNDSETSMDYYNNYQGRLIGSSGGDRLYLEDRVLRSLIQGELVCLSAESPTASIKRTGSSACF